MKTKQDKTKTNLTNKIEANYYRIYQPIRYRHVQKRYYSVTKLGLSQKCKIGLNNRKSTNVIHHTKKIKEQII